MTPRTWFLWAKPGWCVGPMDIVEMRRVARLPLDELLLLARRA